MTINRLHRLVAMGLVLFILPHLTGHLAGLWGQKAFDLVQETMRPLYRNAVVEPVLLAAVTLQVGLGLVLLGRLWRRGFRQSLMRWQFISGVVLTLFLVQHLPAMAAARWWAGLDTTYWWPASVASRWPFALYFWPYYLTGVLAFFLHIGIGLSLILRRKGRTEVARSVVWGSLVVGLVWGALIIAGISGVLRPVNLPPEWQEFPGLFLPG